LTTLAVDAVPPGLAEALERRGGKLERGWWEGSRSYLFAASPEGRLFGRASGDLADAAMLEHEVAVREIVGVAGPLRAPPVLEHGRDWLLETAIEAEPFAGSSHVKLVTAAAERLQGLELPELPPRPGPGRVRARLRLLASPLPVSDLRRARRIMAELRLPLVTTHGDFHPGNVLISSGAAWVVDWELSGHGPAGSDLLLFGSTVESEDRERLLEAAVELAGDRREAQRLAYAVLVRAAAAKLSAAQPFDRDPEGAKRLLALLPAARAAAGF
jgi:hypothetical protein